MNAVKPNPLVTVNILSFNRKDELCFTLTKVFEQDYKNIEVIVVDNASSDGTQQMVKKEFPSVNLIELKENIGISGWNRGFEVAKGDYILVLDDDSYPEKGTISCGLKNISADERLGIIGFNVFNNRMKDFEKIGFNGVPLMFIGCGALINHKLFEEIGGFNETYFIYNHEQDYSIRCYNANYKIIVPNNCQIIHNQSPIRPEKNINPYRTKFRYYHYYLTISYFIIQNFNYSRSGIYLIKWIINRLIIAIVYSYYTPFFKATYKLISLLPKILRGKNKINKKIQELYKYGNHPLVDRDYFPNFKKPNLFK